MRVINVYELYHSSKPRYNLFAGQVKKGLRFSESNLHVLVVVEGMKDVLFAMLRDLGLSINSYF